MCRATPQNWANAASKLTHKGVVFSRRGIVERGVNAQVAGALAGRVVGPVGSSMDPACTPRVPDRVLHRICAAAELPEVLGPQDEHLVEWIPPVAAEELPFLQAVGVPDRRR